MFYFRTAKVQQKEIKMCGNVKKIYQLFKKPYNSKEKRR